jgi:hypothetical protein
VVTVAGLCAQEDDDCCPYDGCSAVLGRGLVGRVDGDPYLRGMGGWEEVEEEP